ncbi:ATP-binding protein [Paralcaligenes sp. KSB-10]|uniref:ATP-binding protein n=1 Tax=Paralcaligenes sp. KSB-10 TaxID=2901142 RepID=UPI001E2B5558|nr:ATP-binding protein [Paralcaligenes sp. KSB-10]UHL62521.1 ATP-binding protein [Paralcaligenes sp. KSB-10]
MKWHRLIPRSLRVRMILLTLGTVLLAQAATVATITYYRKKFTEEVAVQYTATTISTLRAALAKIPADERADFVRTASQNEWHLWSRSLPSEARINERPRLPPELRRDRRHGPPPLPHDMRRDLRLFVQSLNIRLNDGTRVALSKGPRPRLYISLMPNLGDDEAPQNREWLVIPLDHISPPVTTPAIFFWLGGMGLFLLISAIFSWHITRPLTRLASAADQLAAGQPQRVTPSGPTETRILGERFNAMLDALAESGAVRRTLLAGLPHDLKGPLSRMWLRIEMVDDSTFKDGMRKDIQDMQRMVNQFIGFVRGTDPGTYHFTPLALNGWLEEQTSAWESAGSAVRLTELWAKPLTLNADRIALGRLLDNLVTNALNHGKPPVEVALTADDHWAIMTISDYGPGIAPERRGEALRPFSRLDDARTLTGSVGLGLALADAIAKAHGGTLTLGQAPSGGLRVTVKLPLLATADA